jgi:hypothetical protein
LHTSRKPLIQISKFVKESPDGIFQAASKPNKLAKIASASHLSALYRNDEPKWQAGIACELNAGHALAFPYLAHNYSQRSTEAHGPLVICVWRERFAEENFGLFVC